MQIVTGSLYIGCCALVLPEARWLVGPNAGPTDLFDEKIAGSFHFTPGNAYDMADNGNRSDVHWDMVLIQRPDYGGGEIWFDDVLVRKDGEFVIPDVSGLNRGNLV